MTLEELEAEALKLDPASRSRLAAALTKSLEEISENERERIWLQEAMKRSRELRQAQPAVLPAPDLPLLEGEDRPPLPTGQGRGEGKPRPARKKPSVRPRRGTTKKKRAARPVRAPKKRAPKPRVSARSARPARKKIVRKRTRSRR